MWSAIWLGIQTLMAIVIGPATSAIASIETAQVEAKTSQATLAEAQAVHQMDADTTVAGTNAHVVIAEQRHWFTRMIRPLVVLPFILWLWSSVALDKVILPWFGIDHSTDDLGSSLHWAFVLVLTSYFGPLAVSDIRNR